MVSCWEEARLRNKKYVMVNLQPIKLQILKKTDCFLCFRVSLIYEVVWQVISSKLLLRLTINSLFFSFAVKFSQPLMSNSPLYSLCLIKIFCSMTLTSPLQR